mgnify:CR=1 FL=1
MHTSGVISISLISSIFFRILSSVGTRQPCPCFHSSSIRSTRNTQNTQTFPRHLTVFRFNPLRRLESAPARGCRDSECRVRLCFVIGHGMPCPYHASALAYSQFSVFRFPFSVLIPLCGLESAPARQCRDAACSVRFVCRSRTLHAASLPCSRLLADLFAFAHQAPQVRFTFYHLACQHHAEDGGYVAEGTVCLYFAEL